MNYPHANFPAELGVKVVKRMLMKNGTLTGSLECDEVSRALLTLRNMPCNDLGMNQAKALFGRNLRDHFLAAVMKLKLKPNLRGL